MFKPGDKIICVDNSNLSIPDILTINTEYVVETSDQYDESVVMVKDNGKRYKFYAANRFVLATPIVYRRIKLEKLSSKLKLEKYDALKVVKDISNVLSDDGQPFFNTEWLIKRILFNDEDKHKWLLEERRKKIEKLCSNKGIK